MPIFELSDDEVLLTVRLVNAKLSEGLLADPALSLPTETEPAMDFAPLAAARGVDRADGLLITREGNVYASAEIAVPLLQSTVPLVSDVQLSPLILTTAVAYVFQY